MFTRYSLRKYFRDNFKYKDKRNSIYSTIR